MQFTDVRPQPFTDRIRCDRCGLESRHDEVEFQEFACINMLAGYGSIFGDGNHVQIDLCQHCLKLSLEPWLRVTEPPLQGALVRKLSLFDPELHGGEFPMSETGHAASGDVPAPLTKADPLSP